MEHHAARTNYRDAIFWDVDTQVDFIMPGGKLYAAGAEGIVGNLERLTQHARQRHILVIASVDAHKPDDPEFNEWPPHCIAGTPGQAKIEQTRLAPTHVVPNVPAELPQDLAEFAQIVLEKQAVDVFTNPNIEALLRHLGKPVITVYGVVTDVCVALAARGLLHRGYCVRVVTDSIWPFRHEEAQKTLAELRDLGAHLLTTNDITSVREPAQV